MFVQDRTFPPPLVFDAVSGTHKSTVILLHGRGRKAEDFAAEFLLSAPTITTGSPPITIQTALPDTRFIFARGRKQRATKYKRSLVRQWFDDWHLRDPDFVTDAVDQLYDDGLQTAGLGETVAYLHDLVTRESQLIEGGSRNIVLAGFSQGGAAALLAGLLWNRGSGEQIGGLIGICTWLPYLKQMMNIFEGRGVATDCLGSGSGSADKQYAQNDAFDPFERQTSPDSTNESPQDPLETALAWLRDEIELPMDAMSGRSLERSQRVPLLLCHGSDDTKVMPERSREASDTMSTLGGFNVVRKTYEGVAHETSAAMLADILAFLISVFDKS